MVELNLGTIQELSSMLRLYKTVWETVRAQQEKLSVFKERRTWYVSLNTKRTTGFTLYGLHAFMTSYVFYNTSLGNRDNFDTR